MTRRCHHYVSVCLAAVCFLTASCSPLRAQTGTGTIQGTVHDPTGAAVPGAHLHIVNAATGQAGDSVSNGSGFYVVPQLFTGNYSLEISAQGFSSWKGNVALQVGQTAVVDPALSVGTTESVTVVGDISPLANYQDATVNNTLENRRIMQLPMNGRNVQTLVGITTPGIEGGRVNGNREAAFEYVQDGAALANRDSGGATLTPDPDSIQEVRVETQNSSAKFNRPATAVLTTKSGTNAIHGTAFETARNNAFGIAKARQDTFLQAPKYIRNEFGASVGGPMFIPRLYDGRNKSFFFVAYERYSLRQGTSSSLYVPTMAMRQGNFQGAVDGAGNPITIYDSATSNPTTYRRQPFANNQIPLSRMSPLAKSLYAMTPQPTTGDNPLISPNWVGATPNNLTTPTVTLRLDHRFNENNTAYVRYTNTNQQQLSLRGTGTSSNPYYGPSVAGDAANLSLSVTQVNSGAVSYTHIFSPTFYSETVLANTWERDYTGGGGNQAVDYASQLGLPNDFSLESFPAVRGSTFGASTNSIFMAFSPGNYRSNSQITTVLDENLTKVLGRHQLGFGGRYRHERIGIFPDQNPNTTTFSGQGSGLEDPTTGTAFGQVPFTGLAAADFFMGNAQSYTEWINQGYLHIRDQEIAAYVQDDFHVTPKLVLNLGLRWEAHPALHEQNNAISSFDFANKAIVLGQPLEKLYQRGVTTPSIIAALQNLGTKFETADAAGLPEGLLYNNNATFAPRLGLAYRPFGDRHSLVIRGGFGRYIYPPPTRNFYAETRSNPPYTENYTRDFTSAAQAPDAKANSIVRLPQAVVAGQNSANAITTTGLNAFTPGVHVSTLSPHYPVTYADQYNLTFEQQLKPDSVLRLTYSYNHGSNLEQYKEYNNAPSAYVWYARTGKPLASGYYASVAQNPYDNVTYGYIETQQKTGVSNDNAFQANYQRLYKHGYAFQLYYVFSAAFRNGGNGWRDSFIYPMENFAPNAPFSNEDQENHVVNYVRDTSIPKHRIRWNFIVDLPVGQGKAFLGNSNRFVNELVGGWQLAGDGTVSSQFFGLSTSNWGDRTPTKVYKHGQPVQDCRSGVCYKSYLYFNGYIAPNLINTANGVQGLPGDYTPNQVPLSGTNNNVSVMLANGAKVTTAYNPGPGIHPFAKTYFAGPFNWNQDLSLFRIFPITEGVHLRVNVDAFNVFNIQGYSNPDGTTGIESLRTSYNTPRQLQLTARVTW